MKTKSSKKTIIIIIAIILILVLMFEMIRWRISIHSIMESARECVTIYIPDGLPDDYFHNFAFQDPVSICTYKLSEKEQSNILNDISLENSKWKNFSGDECSDLYDAISFLSKKERKSVNFNLESYYCCYTRDDAKEGTWIDLKDANYYTISYYIFIYNPNDALYNLVII